MNEQNQSDTRELGVQLVRQVQPVRLAFVALISLTVASLPAQLVNRKLNGPLGNDVEVGDFLISPDSKWVVYTTIDNGAGITDVHSVSIQGGASVQLNTALPSGTGVRGVQITADSRRVVFMGPLDTSGFEELYSVAIAGPAHERVKLNGPLTAGGDVATFALSRDGTRVVYHADEETDQVNELFSVPVDGPATASVKINGPLAVDGDVLDYAISPDSAYVVYRADQQVNNMVELYSVPIEGPGSAWVKLNGPLVTNGEVFEKYVISPDGARVVYRARQLTESAELFSVPTAGPAGLGRRISAPRGSGGALWADIYVTPNSSRVLYRDWDGGASGTQLYSVPIAGPDSAAEVISNLPTDFGVHSARTSPDSRLAVYLVDGGNPEGQELYSVPVEGPPAASVQLTNTSTSGERVSPFFEISPDSSRVAFFGYQFSSTNELYSTPIDQYGLKTINRPLGPSDDVEEEIRISPDSGHVAYRSRRVNILLRRNELNLYTVPIDGPGTASIQMNRPTIRTGEVMDFEYSPDGFCIVYIGDQDTDEQVELYVSSWRPTAVGGWHLYR